MDNLHPAERQIAEHLVAGVGHFLKATLVEERENLAQIGLKPIDALAVATGKFTEANQIVGCAAQAGHIKKQ